MYDDNAYYAFPHIEQQRTRLLHSTNRLQQTDYGTGARASKGKPSVAERPVAEVARRHLESPQTGALLFRLANYMTTTRHEPLTIVELGTSLGITTAYLASVSPQNTVWTYEGAEHAVEIAMDVWRKIGLTNITPVIGNIDETLPLSDVKHIDLAYIDANHTYEATVRYFKQLLPAAGQDSIYVIDDIHHSPEMEHAWQEIQAMQQVTSTIDCYHLGLVFFNRHYLRKHYRMRI